MSITLVVANRMREQAHGQIVVLSSVAAERPRRSNFIYGSTKAGIDAFAEGLTYALDGTGVSVLTVRPGFVHTKLTADLKEAPFAVEASEVAAAVLNGVARGHSVVWVPRQVRWVMSGIRHLPRAAMRRIKQ
jgi:decaprenylphospho-beta-D-erythro-pentofuranosid-2-ulose 2-reductase